MMMRFNYKTAQSSPWGKVDTVSKYCRGLSFVGTPRHGGLRVSKKVFDEYTMDKDFLKKNTIEWKNYYFFEEDCAMALFLFDAPRLLKIVAEREGWDAEEYFQDCKRSVECWYPDYYKDEVES